MRKFYSFILIITIFSSCIQEGGKVDRYRAEKHVQDSVALESQLRSLTFYEMQLDQMMPQADSLIALFKYEKNDKYQDHGYYVVRNEKLKIKNYELRVMVRDDGKEILAYKNGKRVDLPPDNEAFQRAEQLQITISDIRELEKRIQRTSLEVQKYQKRLQK